MARSTGKGETVPDSTEPELINPGATIVTPERSGDPLKHVGTGMPAVQEHAIEAAKADADKLTAENTSEPEKTSVAPNGVTGVPVDRNGNTFDPDKHESDGGKPRLSPNGMLRLKRGNAARKLNTGEASPKAPVSPVNPGIPTPNTVAAAQGMAHLTVTAGVIIGGEEFAPMRKEVAEGIIIDDMASLTSAYTTYFHARGITDLPPGVVLVAALLGYIAPRFAMPKTQTRWQKVKTWCVGKYAQWKYGKKPPKVEAKPAEPTDTKDA